MMRVFAKNRIAPCAMGLGLAWAVMPPLAAGASDCLARPTTLAPFPISGAVMAKWNGVRKRLAYGKMVDGSYRIFTSDADGQNEQALPVQHPQWAAGRHQSPIAWHPSGHHLVALVEHSTPYDAPSDPQAPRHARTHHDAIPGYGAYSDYWVVSHDGKTVDQFLQIPANNYNYALTHGVFSPDGTLFAWTERIKAPNLFDANMMIGAYRFGVAQVQGQPPRLTHIRYIIPGGVDQGGEVDGISPDNQTIAFYSTYKTKSIFSTRIYTYALATQEIKELTTQSWSQAPVFTPDGRHLVYMSGHQADVFWFRLQGADWWIMRADGTHKRRLTYMNKYVHPQSAKGFRLAGVVDFDGDSSFYGDVLTESFGLTGYIVKVTIDPACIE